jgi:hypothetical protein
MEATVLEGYSDKEKGAHLGAIASNQGYIILRLPVL